MSHIAKYPIANIIDVQYLYNRNKFLLFLLFTVYVLLTLNICQQRKGWARDKDVVRTEPVF